MIILRHLPPMILLLTAILGANAQALSTAPYTVDQENSLVRISVYRSGLLKLFAHNHLVSTKVMTGKLEFDPPQFSKGKLSLVLPVASFEVDIPAQRQMAGDPFSKPVPAHARQATRANMLGTRLLDAEQFPEIVISGNWVEGKLNHGNIRLSITVRGNTQNILTPVSINLQDETLITEGSFKLRLSEFGILPFTAAGGTIKIADELDIHYRFIFRH